jgi:hypothetical protein
MSIVRRKQNDLGPAPTEELGKSGDVREYAVDSGGSAEVSSTTATHFWAPPRAERTRRSSRKCLKCGDRCRIVEHSEGVEELRCFKGHSFWPHLNDGTMLD